MIWVVFFLAQLADVLTTLYALGRGGAHEANPVVAFLMRKIGRGWIVTKLGVATAAALWLHHEGHDQWIWVASAGFFLLAANNLRISR